VIQARISHLIDYLVLHLPCRRNGLSLCKYVDKVIAWQHKSEETF
jgi:hypothetical protein